MKLRELLRENKESISFCFGRMNPPTIGHKALMDATAAANSNYKIFTSQSQDKKENPLSYETKIKFLKELFPEHSGHIVYDTGLNTIMKIASSLYDEGYKDVTFVAGSDRLDSFKKLLTDYNGVEGKSHGFYKFDKLDFVSSGEREDGAEGVAGVSASGARAAAKEGDKEAFEKATGAGDLTDDLYNAVRKGLGLEEGSWHISPSGVKTDMDPSDDDYEINYGKEGLVAKDRKSRKVDVATGTKSVEESCKYGRYYCSTDKKWKCRTGPKQSRKSK